MTVARYQDIDGDSFRRFSAIIARATPKIAVLDERPELLRPLPERRRGASAASLGLPRHVGIGLSEWLRLSVEDLCQLPRALHGCVTEVVEGAVGKFLVAGERATESLHIDLLSSLFQGRTCGRQRSDLIPNGPQANSAIIFLNPASGP